jgi:hypothetical protein
LLATSEGRSHIGRVIRIAISQAAFDAIASTLPLGSVAFENQRDANGDWFIWIPHDVLAKLKAIRRVGDSYSDVIVALAEETAGRWKAHADLRASSTLRGGRAEQRMIPAFPGEMRKAILRRKSIPHPDYLFKTPTCWRMRAEKMRTLAEEADDPTVRAMMLRIAADYDRVAERANDLAAHNSIMFRTAEVRPQSRPGAHLARMRDSTMRASPNPVKNNFRRTPWSQSGVAMRLKPNRFANGEMFFSEGR